MKHLAITLVLVCLLAKQEENATKIELLSKERDSSIFEGYCELVVYYCSPVNTATFPNDLHLIAGNDTIMYNTDNFENVPEMVEAGGKEVKVEGRWWSKGSLPVQLESQYRYIIEVNLGSKPQELPEIIFSY